MRGCWGALGPWGCAVVETRSQSTSEALASAKAAYFGHMRAMDASPAGSPTSAIQQSVTETLRAEMIAAYDAAKTVQP
jgi:hypothetical protein